jgi:epoxyqueuosine reductase
VHTPTPQQQLGHELIERAKSLGFACAGISSLEPSAHEQALHEWLDAGMHGEMQYLNDHREMRAQPERILDGAQCALVVGDLYASRDDNTDPEMDDGHGRIARYARGKDYHKIIKKRLVKLLLQLQREHPDAQFKAFVDTAPVPERELAKRAGIGWVGKHTLIIHPRLGSYMFLGGILMTLDASNPPEIEPVSDHCGSCTRCIDACPTDAITPYRVDARRCISYLTIEHRSPIEPKLASKMGDWIYGCDICQEVCPHNSPKPTDILSERTNPAYKAQRSSFDLLEVLGWTQDDRQEAFMASAMKRAKLGMMQRNASAGLANRFGQFDSGKQQETIKALHALGSDQGADSLARTAAGDALRAIDHADAGNK